MKSSILKNNISYLRKCFNYILKHKILAISIILLTIISSTLMVLGPKALSEATDYFVQCLTTSKENFNYNEILQYILASIIIYLLYTVFTLIKNRLVVIISEKICYEIRNDMINKVCFMKQSSIEKYKTGDILSRFTNDIDLLGQNLPCFLDDLFTAIITIIAIFIIMFLTNWVLTLPLIIILLTSAFVILLFLKKSQKYFNKQQDILGHINSDVEETIRGLDVVKTYQHTSISINNFKKKNNDLYNIGIKATFLSKSITPVLTSINNVGYAIILTFGGILVLNNAMTIGDIQAFIMYIKMFSLPINTLAGMSVGFQQIIAASIRIFEFLDNSNADLHKIKTKNCSDFATVKNSQNDIITFKDVDFSYNEKNQILKDFNLSIKKGEKIALVGESGSGKSTICKLLLRFYDIDNGKILLEGRDIRLINIKDIRKKISMVTQNAWLFSGTINQNLRFSNNNASDNQIKTISRLSNADSFINKLPNKYDYQIKNNGENLSEGQKQIISITRTMLSGCDIMILDEATSNIDTNTETQINKSIDNFVKDKTLIVIAHKLSTIRNMDRIIYLKDGAIIETGTHEQLIKKKGAYYKQYNKY